MRRNFYRMGPARIVVPYNLPPWMQRVSARVKMRLASCKEVEGRKEPCNQLHKLPAWERPIYFVNDVPTTEGHFINQLGEGVETIQAAVRLIKEG